MCYTTGEEDTRYFEPASLDLSHPCLGPFEGDSPKLIPHTLTLQQRPSSSNTGKVTEHVAANARKAGNLSGGQWTSTEIAELLKVAEQVRAVTGTIGMTGWVKVASKMGTERSAKAVMRKFEYEMRKLEGRGTGRKSTRGPGKPSLV